MNEVTKEGIERKYRRKSTFFSLGALSGILLGGSAVFYGAGFMDNKKDNFNPFSNKTEVVRYKALEETLSMLQMEYIFNKSYYRDFYFEVLPESKPYIDTYIDAKNAFIKNSKDSLGKAINLVNKELEAMEMHPDVRAYKNKAEELKKHYGNIFRGGTTLIIASGFGLLIYDILNSGKKKKELESLEKKLTSNDH